MNNELKIKPLLQYEVTHMQGTDIFTADSYVNDDGEYIFYRTGNVVRVYPQGYSAVSKIVVTPVDQAEVPQ
jgi:hypothetical protein